MAYIHRALVLISLFTSTLATAQQLEVVAGNISQNTTWGPDRVYLLTGFVYVKNQATLTILPGTTIKGDKNSRGTLIVTRGAKLIADGTRQQPIVFTSSQATPAPGDWGGVVVCGYAPTNAKTNGINCLGVAEGAINTPYNDAYYGGGDQPGGCKPDDNSGIIRFVRIEYGGFPFQINNETNGLTLAGVGNGTNVDYVQVSHSGDDGFEFFGGTVNCKHLLSYGSKDDDFDFDLGYQGNIQFALAIRNPALSDISGSNGLEIDNDNSGTPAIPKTRPNLSNFTIVGPSGTMDANYRRTAHLRRNAEPALFNSLLIGNFPVGIFIDGVGTIANTQNNLLEIKNCRVADAAELLKSTEPTFNINQWFGNSDWNNVAVPSSAPFALSSPFDPNTPNAQPTLGSSVNDGAAFTSPRANHPFFEQVSYLGAFEPTEDWSCGWAKFQVLNTNCTVSTEAIPSPLQDLKVFPTIAPQEFQLQLQLTEPSSLSVDLFNLSGALIGNLLQEQSLQGAHSWTFPTEQLPNGFYLLVVRAGNSLHTQKLVIAR